LVIFLIWSDFYLVFFIHSLFVGPIIVKDYFLEYFQVALYLFDWFAELNYLLDLYVSWLLSLPAALLFFLRFSFSTFIGIWIVRKVNFILIRK
jgi:hypothetical protein